MNTRQNVQTLSTIKSNPKTSVIHKTWNSNSCLLCGNSAIPGTGFCYRCSSHESD